ncbi:hypothetical protein BpHYR1_027807, partial [Brachionus plicatilis]
MNIEHIENLSIILKCLPQNGLLFRHYDQTIAITNSCSIDYFILFSYIVSKKNNFSTTSKSYSTKYFEKFLRETNSCLDRNNWNLVRLLWFTIVSDLINFNHTSGRVNVKIVPAFSIVKQRIKVYGQVILEANFNIHKRVVHCNSKQLSNINGIETERNNSFSMIIKYQKPIFNHGYPLLLIVSNSISNLLPEEIPYYIEKDDLKYILIGITLH